MARFRQNHKMHRGQRSGVSIRLFLMIAVTALALLLLWRKLANWEVSGNAMPETKAGNGIEYRHFLPEGGNGELVHHRYFSLSYSEADEQAEWVAYQLTRDLLEGRRYPRTDWFEADPAVSTGSAGYEDYRGSRYTRGHLVPAADMAFHPDAMEETFLMSNISPQATEFNGGIWRELEEQVRDWARENRSLYIVTGPVLTGPKLDKIGRSEVTVPSMFYKVIADVEGPDRKAIGFLVPNALSTDPLLAYAVSIDSVEVLTGFDFFAHLDIEDLESTVDPRQWDVSEARFRERVEEWNKRGN